MAFGQPGDSKPDGNGNPAPDLFSTPRYARLFLVGGAIVPVGLGVFAWLVPSSSKSGSAAGWLVLVLALALVGSICQVVGRRDAINQTRLLGQPAYGPFYYLKLLSPRSLRRAAAQAGWAPVTGPVVIYGLPIVLVSGLIRLAVVSKPSSASAPVHQGHHLTPLHVVYATALTVTLFALVFAGLLQIRRIAIQRHWGRRDRPLDLVARGWGPVSQWRANRDNLVAVQRGWIEWDIQHDFSRRARNVCLAVAGTGLSVAVTAVIIHAVWPNT